MSWKDRLSDEALGEVINAMEDEGMSGSTDRDLDEANREQTRRMSDGDIVRTFRERTEAGKGAAKVANEAERRGLDLDDDYDDGPGSSEYDMTYND